MCVLFQINSARVTKIALVTKTNNNSKWFSHGFSGSYKPGCKVIN